MIHIARRSTIWITAGPGCEDMIFLRLKEYDKMSLWVGVKRLFWGVYIEKGPEFRDFNGMMRKPGHDETM